MGIEVGWRSEVGLKLGKDFEIERLRIVSYLSVSFFFSLDICFIPLILLCVGIGLVSLGIIILLGFLIKLFC